jgi:hypothetical protein
MSSNMVWMNSCAAVDLVLGLLSLFSAVVLPASSACVNLSYSVGRPTPVFSMDTSSSPTPVFSTDSSSLSNPVSLFSTPVFSTDSSSSSDVSTDSSSSSLSDAAESLGSDSVCIDVGRIVIIVRSIRFVVNVKDVIIVLVG